MSSIKFDGAISNALLSRDGKAVTLKADGAAGFDTLHFIHVKPGMTEVEVRAALSDKWDRPGHKSEAFNNNLDELVVRQDDGSLVLIIADSIATPGTRSEDFVPGSRFESDQISGQVLSYTRERDFDRIVGTAVNLAIGVGTMGSGYVAGETAATLGKTLLGVAGAGAGFFTTGAAAAGIGLVGDKGEGLIHYKRSTDSFAGLRAPTVAPTSQVEAPPEFEKIEALEVASHDGVARIKINGTWEELGVVPLRPGAKSLHGVSSDGRFAFFTGSDGVGGVDGGGDSLRVYDAVDKIVRKVATHGEDITSVSFHKTSTGKPFVIASKKAPVTGAMPRKMNDCATSLSIVDPTRGQLAYFENVAFATPGKTGNYVAFGAQRHHSYTTYLSFSEPGKLNSAETSFDVRHLLRRKEVLKLRE